SFLRHLESEGIPICKQMLEIRPLKIGQPLPRDLSILQIKLLLNTIQDNKMDRAWFLLMLHSGLRTCEVRNLKIDDVDLSQRTVYIRETKNQNEHVTYLSPPTVEAIQAYFFERGSSSYYLFTQHQKQLSKRYCQSRLRTIGKQVGIKITPHRLRHNCSTLLLNAGMSIFALQSLLGHRYVETTLNYARLYDETLAKQFVEAQGRTTQSMLHLRNNFQDAK
ncbi:MAG TPA: site-specific integrase, partial [Methanosarcina sp.]|nr:site-specific integrase [Methanosarcina sp.]